MLRKFVLAAVGTVATLALPVLPAAAKRTVTPMAACSAAEGVVVSGSTGCAGLYSGNIFSSSAANVALQNLGLLALSSNVFVNPYTTLTFGGASSSSFDSFTKIEGDASTKSIDFGKTLYGNTIIGAHFGNMAGTFGNASVLWSFDFGTTGASGLTLLDSTGFSNAVLYSTGSAPVLDAGAVPEPATWALLTLAFGAVGGAMRRRNAQVCKQRAHISFV